MGNQKVTTTDSQCTVYMVSMHRCLPLPIPFHYELSEPAFWAEGLSEHAFTETVVHRGLRIAKEDHDLGAWLPHIPFAALNMVLPFEVMNSSRKMMFAASTVRMNGAPTGCSNKWSTPMLACSLITPMPAYPDNEGNTVLVGMTDDDFLAGAVAVGAAVLVELATFVLSIAGLPKSDDMKFTKSALEFVADEMGIPGFEKEDLIKPAAALLSGGFKILTTGEGEIELGLGGYAGEVKVVIKVTKDADGSRSVDVEGERGGLGGSDSGGFGERTQEHTEVHRDGSSKRTEVTHKANPDGTVTRTVVEEEFDREGRKTGGRTTSSEHGGLGAPTRPPKTTEHPLINPPSAGDELL
jgi:hypothetical protein